MSNFGKLCHHYTASSRVLVHKSGGVSLVYKAKCGEETTVTFAWGTDGKDLDICAYWEAAPNMKAGWQWSADWSQPTTTSTTESGAEYTIGYSGDIRNVDSAEWVKIKKFPWSKGSRVFKVYLNFYGYDSSQYPATTCTVIAAQMNGPTKMLTVNCGHRSGNRADPAQDPCVTISFDATGKLQSVTQ